ncbi:Band 4.1-like protein 5 [Chelonia mydas]|uniref:Band 4.1-like protein 5 n=1 Tax=Chelonia mydas TaxID=8469 RepID=M7BQN6_CHEMY|nr:Band 4.1-like protein 5 [Chelonia mydas]
MLRFFRRTLGRRSMRKHVEKERLREAQRAATHIPAAGDAKSIITCRVSLLDGTDVSVDLPKKAKGQHLFEQIMYHLDLVENDYFGLRFMDSAQVAHWLDNTKSIKKQVKIGPPYCLHLRVKFYSSEPNNLREELTRYLFVLQLKQDILSGKLECPFDTAVQLAAYTLQANVAKLEETSIPNNVLHQNNGSQQLQIAVAELVTEGNSCCIRDKPRMKEGAAAVTCKSKSSAVSSVTLSWNAKPTLPVIIPSGPVLVEIENFPRSPGASQQDMKWPFDADDCRQRGGSVWNAWAPPSTQSADRHYTDFVHERNVKNAGIHSDAIGYAVQTTMTDL